MTRQPDCSKPSMAAGVPAAPPIDSSTLLNGQDRIAIAHQGEVYCLRLTRQGKLILTK